MQDDPDCLFPRASYWRILFVLLWLLGLVLLLTISDIFPDSTWLQKTFLGKNGLYRVLWVTAYLGLTWAGLCAWRPISKHK